MSIFACNTRKVATTMLTPLESLMGYTAETASGLALKERSKKELKECIALISEASCSDEVKTLREESVRIRNAKVDQIKVRYDKRVHEKSFEIGDEVLLYNSALLKQWSHKLEERWLGPYVITWKGSLGAYVISTGEGQTKMVSGDQLKQYHRR